MGKGLARIIHDPIARSALLGANLCVTQPCRLIKANCGFIP